MICYLVTRYHAYTIRSYLDNRVDGSTTAIRIVAYQDLADLATLPSATYVFADLERLAPDQIQAAEFVYRQLAGARPDLMLLNQPARVKRRFDLLQQLHASRIHRHRIHRAFQRPGKMRFPVFLREENDHTGNLSRLVSSPAAYYASLATLMLQGYRLRDLVAVEFCDTSSDEGIFNKYAAFVIDGRILPRHAMFSTHWMIKHSDIVEGWTVDLERQYLADNPHAETLRRVVELAGIDYGRIDYSVDVDGALQVWEINTNPVILQAPERYQAERLALQQAFEQAIARALADIDHPIDDRTLPNPLLPHPRLRRAIARRPAGGGLRRKLVKRILGPGRNRAPQGHA